MFEGTTSFAFSLEDLSFSHARHQHGRTRIPALTHTYMSSGLSISHAVLEATLVYEHFQLQRQLEMGILKILLLARLPPSEPAFTFAFVNEERTFPMSPSSSAEHSNTASMISFSHAVMEAYMFSRIIRVKRENEQRELRRIFGFPCDPEQSRQQ